MYNTYFATAFSRKAAQKQFDFCGCRNANFPLMVGKRSSTNTYMHQISSKQTKVEHQIWIQSLERVFIFVDLPQPIRRTTRGETGRHQMNSQCSDRRAPLGKRGFLAKTKRLDTTPAIGRLLKVYIF